MLLGFHLVWIIELFRNPSKIMTPPTQGPIDVKYHLPLSGVFPLPARALWSRTSGLTLDLPCHQHAVLLGRQLSLCWLLYSKGDLGPDGSF